MKKSRSLVLLLVSLCVALIGTSFPAGVASAARDSLYIVGSSTVYPFSTVVAEHLGKKGIKTPKVESTGTGGGFKLFCAGVGTEHPDISNASRQIKDSEKQLCRKNGVNDVIELKIGYDGIVLANSKKAKRLNLSTKDVFLALAKEVPDPKDENKIIPNPYKTWHDLNPELPNIKIEVYGPPPTSGTRDAFVELAMENGAESIPSLKAMKKTDEKRFKQISQTIREDGAFIEAGENDNLIVQKLVSNVNAFGIFGFSYLDENNDKIQGSVLNGAEPTFENIVTGKYPLARPLFFYVKKAHIGTVPGIKEYMDEFISDKAIGQEGYCLEKGLIPLGKNELDTVKSVVKELKTINME